MKAVILVSLLFLSGCSIRSLFLGPKFKVGECMISEDAESWEYDVEKFSRVLEVGKKKYKYAYLYKWGDEYRVLTNDFPIGWMDMIKMKTDCPKEFEGIGGPVDQ